MKANELSFIIRKGIFKVYDEFGPGLYGSVYEVSFGELAILAYKADLVVERQVLVEIKSVETIHEVHHKQIITYLKLSGLKLGLLVNFNTENINKSIYRKVNGL